MCPHQAKVFNLKGTHLVQNIPWARAEPYIFSQEPDCCLSRSGPLSCRSCSTNFEVEVRRLSSAGRAALIISMWVNLGRGETPGGAWLDQSRLCPGGSEFVSQVVSQFVSKFWSNGRIRQLFEEQIGKPLAEPAEENVGSITKGHFWRITRWALAWLLEFLL
jgi:hypothetical protein